MRGIRRALAGLLIFGGSALLVGCEDKRGPATPAVEQGWLETHTKVFRGQDGHQYIVYNQFPMSSGGGGLTHLAGCDHPECKASRARAAGTSVKAE